MARSLTGQLRVVIAGAGVAALETLMGLRAHAAGRLDLTLVAPEPAFVYRPASTARPFHLLRARELSLARLADDVGASLVRDTVASVHEDAGQLVTRNGDLLPFDALVLAVGARWSPALKDGLLWSRDESAAPGWAAILGDLERGAVRSLGLVVPPKAGWPVDAYELALIAAAAARRAGRDTDISLLTAERRALEVLGPAVSDFVTDALAAAEVRLVTDVQVKQRSTTKRWRPEAGSDFLSAAVGRLIPFRSRTARPRAAERSQPTHVSLDLVPGGRERFDSVISLPTGRGPWIGGLAHSHDGFLAVDPDARVEGSVHVWAAGDATTLAIKHGLPAVDQAAVVVEAIAATAGVAVEATPREPRLRGIVAAPDRVLAQPVWVHPGEPLTHCLWWPPGRVAGPHLAPYVARHDRLVHPGVLWHPMGLPVDISVPRLDAEGPVIPTAAHASSPTALLEDATTRQLLAMNRTERVAWAQERRLERELEEFTRHERAVINELEQAGYLRQREGMAA